MEPDDLTKMLMAEPTRLEGRSWIALHEWDLIDLWRAAQAAWPYTKDSGDEPNPKDVLWDALKRLRAG